VAYTRITISGNLENRFLVQSSRSQSMEASLMQTAVGAQRQTCLILFCPAQG
jgi:hypothetical protein